MKKFFYQLKTKVDPSRKDYHYSGWEVVWFDVVEADDKASAKKKIESEYSGIIAEKATKKNKDTLDYKLYLIELDQHHEDFWLADRTCSVCGNQYNILRSHQFGEGYANREICSKYCHESRKMEKEFGNYFEGNGRNKPTIYKITNKNTGKVYIGKTVQVFTLRWYQHFFQPSESKFHQAIKESKPTDWTFEVIEIVYGSKRTDDPIVLEREQYWIDQYDSINNGYNSVVSVNSSTKVAD